MGDIHFHLVLLIYKWTTVNIGHPSYKPKQLFEESSWYCDFPPKSHMTIRSEIKCMCGWVMPDIKEPRYTAGCKQRDCKGGHWNQLKCIVVTSFSYWSWQKVILPSPASQCLGVRMRLTSIHKDWLWPTGEDLAQISKDHYQRTTTNTLDFITQAMA